MTDKIKFKIIAQIILLYLAMLHVTFRDKFMELDAISSKCCCAYSCSENVYLGCLMNGTCGHIYNVCLNVLDDALL